MEKLKVSYRGEWSDNGTYYDQKVKVSKSLLKQINDEIRTAKEKKSHELFFNNHDFIYLDILRENKTFTTLTTARIIKHVLSKMNIDTSRFKTDRNTIIELV